MKRLAILLVFVACAPPPHPEEVPEAVPGAGAVADLVLHDARVWTADPELPRAEAVAVAGERIVAVGGDDEVLSLAGPGTRVVDLDGAFVLPGFNDSHVHFASAARFLEFNLMQTRTQEELVERVRDVVATLEPGEWITGGFWGAYDEWAAGSAGGEAAGAAFTPDLSRIEPLTGDHPVFLRKFDDSEFAANRAALAAVGIDPEAGDEAPPPGVTLVRDAEGRPTGILRGEGVRRLFEEASPAGLSRRRRLAQTRNALARAARHGVTSLSDMSDDEQLAIYRELREEGELTVRVDFRYPLERFEELARRGVRAGDLASAGDAWIRFGRLKGHVDGIMGASTARFFEPYDHQPGNRGRWRHLLVDEAGRFVPERFYALLAGADAAGLQLTVHAIGDEANHLLLDMLERLEADNGRRDRRFRLVHAQVMTAEDIDRAGELGVVAEVQPFHLADDMRWMEERIGHERSRGAYAFASLRDGGAVLSFGSDWPGTAASVYPIDPLPGLYAAVTRETLAGTPPGGWFPDERIGIEEALTAYTAANAYATYEGAIKGTVTPGKLADLAVLDRDLTAVPPEEILEAEVLMTVVGGRVVYEGAGVGGEPLPAGREE